MDTNLIIRNEHKAQIAAFGKETRLAIDEAITAYNALIEKSGKDAAAMARRQAVAVSMMAEDTEALKKAGFDTFKDAAFALVHLAQANATQYRKAGDFIRSENAPAIVNWYSPSALYLFTSKKVPVDAINKAIENKELVEDMPQAAIKEWCEAHSPKQLEDGKAEVVKMFDAHFTTSESEPFSETLSLDDICGKLFVIVGCEDKNTDRIGSFNPHAELTRVSGKGKDKTVSGKGLVIAYMGKFASVTYFPTASAKTAQSGENSATIAAQNATIAKLMAELEALKAAQK